MRLFIGFRLSPSAIERVDRLRDFARPYFGRSVSWAAAERLHLTCAFLGEVCTEGGKLPGIKNSMDAAAGAFRKIEAEFGGLGAFPSFERPRVLWLGLTDGADKLKELSLRLSDALKRGDFAPEGEFRPHLTLGRVKAPLDRAALAALADKAGRPGIRDTLLAMDLVESRLSTAGADHRVIYSSRLL